MHNGMLYSSFNHAQRRDAKSVVEEFGKYLQWSDEVCSLLDLGCGPGDVLIDFVVPIMPTNKRVVAVDISIEMVECARKLCRNDLITFKQLDIAGDFEECERKLAQKFDNITSFYCLHWIQNQRKALSNIYKLLKPQGTSLLLFLASSPIYDIYEKLSRLPRYERYMTDVKSFISPYHHENDPVKLFKKHLSEVGFHAIHVEVRDQAFIYESSDQLRNAVKAVNPFTPRMPDNLRETFIFDYFKIIEELTENKLIENNSKIVSRYQVIVAVLTK